MRTIALDETREMWLLLIGTAIFGLILPFIRRAVVELNPVFARSAATIPIMAISRRTAVVRR